MNILIVSHYFPPHVGGIEIAAYSQALELSKHGNEVTVITSKTKGTSEQSQDGIHIIAVPAWNGLESRGVPFPIFSPSLLWKTFRAVQKADVVHAHDAFYLSTLAAAWMSRILHKPFYLTQHVSMIQHPSRLVRAAQAVVYRTSGRFIFRTAIKIFVYNSRVEQFLQALGVPSAKRAYHINGVDVAQFRPVKDAVEKRALRQKLGLPEKDFLVLFVGRLVPKKGYQKLLEGWPRKKCSIVLAGSRTTPADVKQENGLYNLGSLSHKELADVYRACDIFVLPSVGEGFPLSIQEAMASGLPVVTTDDEGYSRYKLDRQQFKLIQPTGDNVRQAIQELIDNSSDVRKGKGTYGRDYAMEHFSWERLVAKLSDYYNRAIAGES